MEIPAPVAVLALWTMLSYVYIAWDAVPYLYVSGPAGSGKTRVFELLSRLVFRGFVSSNLSAPALFRTLHEKGGTLLLDEAERLNEGATDMAEVRSILLAGYKRGGKASRLESTGDNAFTMAEFAVYGPKAIACIESLTGALVSRCIPIAMFRSSPDSPKPRRRIDADPKRWQQLRDDLHTLALGELGVCAPTLAQQDDVCPLSGRWYELWQPLLSIAQMIDCDGKMNLVAKLIEFAKPLIRECQENSIPERDLIVLRVLAEKLTRGEEPTATNLLQSCKLVQEKTFRNESAGGIGFITRRFGLRPRKGVRGRTYDGLHLEKIREIERNFGVDLMTRDSSLMPVKVVHY